MNKNRFLSVCHEVTGLAFFCCQLSVRTHQQLLCEQPLRFIWKCVIQMVEMDPCSNSASFITLKATRYFISIAVVTAGLQYGDLNLHPSGEESYWSAKNRHRKLLTKQLYCINHLYRQDKTSIKTSCTTLQKKIKTKQVSGWNDKIPLDREIGGKHVDGCELSVTGWEEVDVLEENGPTKTFQRHQISFFSPGDQLRFFKPPDACVEEKTP